MRQSAMSKFWINSVPTAKSQGFTDICYCKNNLERRVFHHIIWRTANYRALLGTATAQLSSVVIISVPKSKIQECYANKINSVAADQHETCFCHDPLIRSIN